MIPHITTAVQEWIEDVARKPVDGSGNTPDVCVIEVYFAYAYLDSIL